MTVLTSAQVAQKAGRAFDSDRGDFFMAMNGDVASNAFVVAGTGVQNGNLMAYFTENVKWGMRLNWLLYVGP